MSFIIFLALGFGSIAWGMKSTEEIIQLLGAVFGSIFLVWGSRGDKVVKGKTNSQMWR